LQAGGTGAEARRGEDRAPAGVRLEKGDERWAEALCGD